MEVSGPERISLSLKSKEAALILVMLEKMRDHFGPQFPPDQLQELESLIADMQKQMGKQHRRFHERTNFNRWN